MRTFAAASRRSFYEVLGVDRTATQKEIKQAYLKEAKTCHPDINPDPSAKLRFQELAEAYSCLGDETKRAAYDRLGHAEYERQPPPPNSPPHEDVNSFDLFRGVLEELGAEGVSEYFGTMQKDAHKAALAAQDGDLAPAKNFAWKYKGVVASIVVPAALL